MNRRQSGHGPPRTTDTSCFASGGRRPRRIFHRMAKPCFSIRPVVRCQPVGWFADRIGGRSAAVICLQRRAIQRKYNDRVILHNPRFDPAILAVDRLDGIQPCQNGRRCWVSREDRQRLPRGTCCNYMQNNSLRKAFRGAANRHALCIDDVPHVGVPRAPEHTPSQRRTEELPPCQHRGP